jgi:hypothetical protein
MLAVWYRYQRKAPQWRLEGGGSDGDCGSDGGRLAVPGGECFGRGWNDC